MYMEYDLDLYEKCTADYFKQEEEAKRKQEAISNRLKVLGVDRRDGSRQCEEKNDHCRLNQDIIIAVVKEYNQNHFLMSTKEKLVMPRVDAE